MKWEDARSHLVVMEKRYNELEELGLFGLLFIRSYKVRYESGERTSELYEDIMDLI